MKIVRKDATAVSTGADDDFPGTFRVILSAPTLDRDGDTLLPEEWKQPLPDRITFDIDHGMSVATMIGSGVPSIDEKGQLIVDGEFSSLPLAQDARTLMKEGHLTSTSVAFMTEKKSVKGGKTVLQRELLNGALVAVPSNRESVVLSAKSGARNSASDSDHIQAIHDHAVALGATADAKTDDDKKSVRFKSIAGSLEATQDRVRDALQDAYPGAWCWLRATIPSGDGGTVVYGVEDPLTYDTELYQQLYTDDGSVVLLQGERSAVDLMEIIKPDPDEESEPSTSDDGAADDPAPAEKSAGAGKQAAPTRDEAEELQVKAAQFRAIGNINSIGD